jgi:excisionase family DNA binding protein
MRDGRNEPPSVADQSLSARDEFLTVMEIAEQLKVNQQTVRNWIDRGELVGVRVSSRRVRVRRSDLDRFISESSGAKIPTEESARRTYEEALEAVAVASQRSRPRS